MEILTFKYLKAYIRYEGIQRVEEFLFPPIALREALLNAVVHKDYSSGIPIQVSVYEDRIVFWSPGQLPEGWTLERLLGKHPSNPCNPLLANAFFRAGYIEAWGRGIETIEHECRIHEMRAPLFDYSLSGLMITFYAAESQPESQPESLEMEILTILSSRGALSKSALSGALGQKSISSHLNKVVRQLLLEQKIAWTIPARPQSRLQKYTLTAAGAAALVKMRSSKSV